MSICGRILWILFSWWPVVQMLDDFSTGDAADLGREWRVYTAAFKEAFPNTKEEV